MDQSLLPAIREGYARALWEVENVISCIPDHLWERAYGGIPVWKQVYHLLHSLDRWLVNPARYRQPAFHRPDLNNLDVPSDTTLSRVQLGDYLRQVREKSLGYLDCLTDENLRETPEDCRWDRFTLLFAQLRHLHTHMGMLMGIILLETGRWPYVAGLEREIPDKTGVFDE